MLFKAEPKVIAAFKVLEGNPSFMTILQYLKDNRERIDQEGRKQTEEYRLRWNQGATQVIDDLLAHRETAKTLRSR